jgi:heptosyltransferase III
MNKPERIIISRTDSIGDVVLTLPMSRLLKQSIPGVRIIFLAASYTREIVMTSAFIDEFIDWSELSKMKPEQQVQELKKHKADAIIHVFPRKEIAILAKKAGIPLRIGTTGRAYHWLTCNRLVPLSRRRSPLHESQLNLRLAASLTGYRNLSLPEIGELFGMTRLPQLSPEIREYLSPDKFNLILHPGSKGSAREWGIDRYKELASLLPENEFRVFITGTKEEGDLLKAGGFFDSGRQMKDITGIFSLGHLIAFIAAADGLVAASTGPLHIASALGKVAIGIYPPIKPMDPGRWAPVGKNASYLVISRKCSKCRKSGPCECIRMIAASQVKDRLYKFLPLKGGKK